MPLAISSSSYVSGGASSRRGMQVLAAVITAALAAMISFVFAPAMVFRDSDPALEYTLQDPGNSSNIELSVVIPAYNEELRLRPMVDATIAYLEGIGDRLQGDYEIMIVDDGSRDSTAAEISRIQAFYPTIKIAFVRLIENQGKGGAVRQGVLHARGRYILMADADGATEISDFASLFQIMQRTQRKNPITGELEGIVVGSRAHLSETSIATRSIVRTILMKAFHVAVMLLCTTKIKDTQCGFKLFTKNTATKIFTNLHIHRWAFDIEVIYVAESLGVPIAEVAVHWREVDGSKLIQSKLDIVKTSLFMARDLLCNRLCYLLGIWKLPSV